MKFCSWITLLTCLIIVLPVFASQNGSIHLLIENNIAKVEQYFNQQDETSPYDEVITLSSQIVQNRQLYNSNTLAKVFVLLAEAATSKGDLAGSLQFAQDGLTINGIDSSIRLNLLLKVAAGYLVNGKYQKVFNIAEQIIQRVSDKKETKHYLIALGYRAMANALLNDYQHALSDLKAIEHLVSKNQHPPEHLELLELLALTHYYLRDYQTALTIQLKILKLRFDLSKKKNLEQNYYQLALIYQRLGKLDDAYNAYWEAKKYALKKSAPILIAYAELGLGEVLLQQKIYPAAYETLIKAEQLFKNESLNKPYLSTLIALAQTSLKTGDNILANRYLKQAEQLAQHMELTKEQIELYQLLSAMFRLQQDIPKALHALIKYTKLTEKHKKNSTSSYLIDGQALLTSEKTKQLAVKLAEKSELHANFSKKYLNQQKVIFLLLLIVALLTLFLIGGWLKYRAKRLNLAYDEVEQAADVLASPLQTKGIYLLAYKMARKYEYPLTVGYLSIDNWKELSFRFNKKILSEVAKTIATLINEYSGEFDRAGILNEGEYLLLCPHQNAQEVEQKLIKLSESIKVRFFANLGEFSVNISFSFAMPSVRDIDPYMFLSKLTESIDINHNSFQKRI